MNALYVTVSIPLLLVLAGFNHAHGLTTFGKTPSNNQQPPQPPVSIPLLLVLAGFNHAHGLTTFGKTPSNNQQPPQPPVQGKPCGDHTTCQGISGTSCVPEPRDSSKKSCLCGDNLAPANGVCSAEKKGPNHLCSDITQCVIHAECKPSNGHGTEKICQCMEGFTADLRKPQCNGGASLSILSGLLVLLSAVLRTL